MTEVAKGEEEGTGLAAGSEFGYGLGRVDGKPASRRAGKQGMDA